MMKIYFEYIIKEYFANLHFAYPNIFKINN